MATKISRFDRHVSSNFGSGTKSFSLKDLVPFTEQLLAQIRLNKTIPEAMAVIYEAMGNRTLRMILMSIATSVKAGNQLSQSMLTFKDLFPNFYIAVIMACERTGKYIEGLESLIIYLKFEKRINDYSRLFILYPSFIFYMICIVVILLLIQFKVVVFTFASVSITALLFLSILLIINYIMRLIRSPRIVETYQTTLLSLPVIGSIYLHISVSRFCYLFNIFHNVGIPFMQNVELLINYMVNSPIYSDLALIYMGLTDKDNITDMADTVKFIPKEFVQELFLFKSGQTKVDSIKNYSIYLSEEINKKALNVITAMRTILINSIIVILIWIYFLIILTP